jgi:hypothetical protein
VEESFLRGAFLGFAAPAETFNLLEKLFAFLMGDCTPFYSWHGKLLVGGDILYVRLAESTQLALGAVVIGALAGLEVVNTLGPAHKLAVLGYSHPFGEAFCGDFLAHIG